MTGEKSDVRPSDKLDLSKREDLSIALMHLISLEEHFYFTAIKTGKEKPVELLKEVRDARKTLMEEIVTKEEGENWCISKHLLGGAMRLIETGTKALERNEKEAERYFNHAFSLYSMFWVLNLDLDTNSVDISRTPDRKQKTTEDNKSEDQERKQRNLLEKMKEKIKDILDCCVEK